MNAIVVVSLLLAADPCTLEVQGYQGAFPFRVRWAQHTKGDLSSGYLYPPGGNCVSALESGEVNLSIDCHSLRDSFVTKYNASIVRKGVTIPLAQGTDKYLRSILLLKGDTLVLRVEEQLLKPGVRVMQLPDQQMLLIARCNSAYLPSVDLEHPEDCPNALINLYRKGEVWAARDIAAQIMKSRTQFPKKDEFQDIAVNDIFIVNTVVESSPDAKWRQWEPHLMEAFIQREIRLLLEQNDKALYKEVYEKSPALLKAYRLLQYQKQSDANATLLLPAK